MDDFHKKPMQLKCNHTFHSKCIINYIEVEYRKQRKQNNTHGIYCKQFKCPLCRAPISCIDINSITYSNYKEYKSLYKHLKKDIKSLQTQSYLISIKFSIKKLFTRIKPEDTCKFLIKDEDLLESISYKKINLLDTKNMMKIYKDLYYSRCICCITSIII
jgi:hypothetical protein